MKIELAIQTAVVHNKDMDATSKVVLPVRVATGSTLRIKGAGDVDGGWSTVECVDAEHARQVMAAYPSAEMPCWRNPNAAWNR